MRENALDSGFHGVPTGPAQLSGFYLTYLVHECLLQAISDCPIGHATGTLTMASSSPNSRSCERWVLSAILQRPPGHAQTEKLAAGTVERATGNRILMASLEDRW